MGMGRSIFSYPINKWVFRRHLLRGVYATSLQREIYLFVGEISSEDA